MRRRKGRNGEKDERDENKREADRQIQAHVHLRFAQRLKKRVPVAAPPRDPVRVTLHE